MSVSTKDSRAMTAGCSTDNIIILAGIGRTSHRPINAQLLHQSDLGRTGRSLKIFSTWVDLRAGLAECATPTWATTVLADVDLLGSTDLEALFDQLLDLIVILVIIELRKRRCIVDFRIVIIRACIAEVPSGVKSPSEPYSSTSTYRLVHSR